jgi:phospholipid transport system substrate-binding protein
MKSFLEGNFNLKRRKFLNFWLVCFLIFTPLSTSIFSYGAHAQNSSDDAKVFIDLVTKEAITTLTGKDLKKEERARLFRILMNKYFSIKGIAKFVVGRHLRNASNIEKIQYLKLFEDLMVATYSERFAKYSGEMLLVKSAEMRGKKDFIVRTSMVKAGSRAKPIKVDWRVRNKGESFTIVDVMVEGISMIMTQRSEFSSFLKSNNGEFNKLLFEIKKRVEESTKNDQSAAR